MEFEALETLAQHLATLSSSEEKIALLDTYPGVKERSSQWHSLPLSLQSALKQLIAIGEEGRVVGESAEASVLEELLKKLSEVDHFYWELGGIVGYQVELLKRLKKKELNKEAEEEKIYHSPQFLDISEEGEAVQEEIEWGIESLPSMGELYPLGGAADRLHLVDRATGVELPAAKLPFAGRSLFEGLIRDLQAREYLYFLRHGVQLTTPIAIMTSWEKENDRHVREILEEANWFGRPPESFRLFVQPLVPAVDSEGRWVSLAPCKPLLKPGGHGALWKRARDEGIFGWLASLGRSKVLVRQINNPIAGLDYGLLAFLGHGCRKGMDFGFASCPRLLKAAEGVNVLIERRQGGESSWVLTNIEYCDFAQFGIEDLPLQEGGRFSRFSSNTNILFADLKAVERGVSLSPFPGLLINLKEGSYVTAQGERRGGVMARLESTMQNIADVFVERRSEGWGTQRTYVTYNHRHKTISTAKKGYVAGGALQETPENCFYDLLQAHRELLEKRCAFQLPPVRSVEEYLRLGPEFLFLYHPALGPLYREIARKVQGGRLAVGAELLLEVADLEVKELEVTGSLRLIAEEPLGGRDPKGILRYSKSVASAVLRDVKVVNEGVDWGASSPFWRMGLVRKGGVEIRLKGRSRLIAEGVTLRGNRTIVVEDGEEMRLWEEGGEVKGSRGALV